MDHFEVFGLPRRFALDAGDLQRRFYDLSRVHHPDFHQHASVEEQAQALEASARLNAAYRALRDPVGRIEYLVQLEEGGETKAGATVKVQTPPDLLAEMFEIQEALEEAKAGGVDDEGRARLAEERDRLLARSREEDERLRGPLATAWDGTKGTERAQILDRVKASLATRAYLRTVVDDLTAVLGEGQEHVAHHRH